MSNYILQIDTATEICSVSVSQDGKTIGQIDAIELNVHASKLTVYTDELLKKLSISYQDLNAIAVSMGPGSYTGLRIGVSSAKGLCYALDIPLIAVNTLDSIFNGFAAKHELDRDTLYVPMLDARRMEVYMSVYDADKVLVAETAAVIVDEQTFEKYLPKKVFLFGSGANKLKATFEGHPNVSIDDSYAHSSASLSEVAYEKFLAKKFEDTIYFEPYYLKEFVATVSKKNVLG